MAMSRVFGQYLGKTGRALSLNNSFLIKQLRRLSQHDSPVMMELSSRKAKKLERANSAVSLYRADQYRRPICWPSQRQELAASKALASAYSTAFPPHHLSATERRYKATVRTATPAAPTAVHLSTPAGGHAAPRGHVRAVWLPWGWPYMFAQRK
jgi:hypothetical protein